MSNPKETGGPAFPRPFSSDDIDPDMSYPAHAGMTLRDYFAAMAMPVFAENAMAVSRMGKSSKELLHNIAPCAYEIADAMLKERDR